jgi:DNA-binding NarL/FixJ family response regulator
MRDSLHFLLRTVPGIETVGSADDSSSALRIISDLCPALVLLDTNLPGEDTVTVLRRLQADACRPRCLVLADTRQQQRDAMAAGADAVLLKGYTTTRLFQVIQTLTSERERQGEWA